MWRDVLRRTRLCPSPIRRRIQFLIKSFSSSDRVRCWLEFGYRWIRRPCCSFSNGIRTIFSIRDPRSITFNPVSDRGLDHYTDSSPQHQCRQQNPEFPDLAKGRDDFRVCRRRLHLRPSSTPLFSSNPRRCTSYHERPVCCQSGLRDVCLLWLERFHLYCRRSQKSRTECPAFAAFWDLDSSGVISRVKSDVPLHNALE